MTVAPLQGVVTPEAVPLELQYANLGSRSLGFGIDLLIQGGAALLLFLGLAAFLNATDASGGLAVAALLLSLFLIIWGYPVILETLWRGRTVGKAAFGLRVVTTEGAPVGFRHAAIRATLGLVDFWLTWGAAAVLSVLLTHRNQRLGDLVAGTLVLRERTGLPPVTAVAFAVPWGMEGYAGVLDVAGLRPDDYRAVRAFLMRAASLPPHVRADLAVQLANPLASRVRPPPPAGTVPELFLACVAAVYQHRAAPVGTPSAASDPAGGFQPQAFAPPPPPPPPAAPPRDGDGYLPPA